MSRYQFQIELLSDTTFGRGDGVAGLVDQEIEYDRYGLPYLRGRTLKGLLSEESDNLILRLPDQSTQDYWAQVACQLFGQAGSGLDAIAKIHFGDARLPKELCTAVAYEVNAGHFTRAEILDSLTTIRRQTATSTQTGVADEGSLRSFRVALRKLKFTADLLLDSDVSKLDTPLTDLLTLLSASAAALRYVGSGRNRGRGHVSCTLLDQLGKTLPVQPARYLDNFFSPQKVSLPTAEVS